MHTPNIIHFLAQLHHHHLYPIQNQISQNVCFQLVWGVCVSVCVCVCWAAPSWATRTVPAQLQV